MVYLVKQKIIGSIEYIVDSDQPDKEVIGITKFAEPMLSTLNLEYTDVLEIRKLTDKDLGDPVVKSAVLRLSKNINPEDSGETFTKRKKRTARKKTV